MHANWLQINDDRHLHVNASVFTSYSQVQGQFLGSDCRTGVLQVCINYSKGQNVRKLLLKLLLTLFIGGLVSATDLFAESGWNEAGVRLGIQASPRREFFRQEEAFAIYGLPWDWHGDSGWGLAPQLTTSLGVLESTRSAGLIGSVGTALALGHRDSGFTTDLGINFNFLNHRYFGRVDFGSILQFGAYVGINYSFDIGIKIGYRLQHISNGHIFYPEDTPNPGLDMHMFGVSYVFK